MYKYLKLKIVNIDTSNYPPIAFCSFLDLNEKTIIVVEKLDILTSHSFDEIKLPLNEYLLKCKIIDENENGYKIDICDPYGVLDNNNNSVFIINKCMLSKKHYDD